MAINKQTGIHTIVCSIKVYGMLYQKHATKLTALLIKRSHLTYSACCLIHYVQHGNIFVFLKKTSTLMGREKKQHTYM